MNVIFFSLKSEVLTIQSNTIGDIVLYQIVLFENMKIKNQLRKCEIMFENEYFEN